MTVADNIEFRHKQDLQEIVERTGESCPPATAKAVSVKAFRFVKEPRTAACFLPQGKKSPRRVLDAKAHEQCSLLGLSMFNSEQAARNRYEILKKSISNVKRSLGTHLAMGSLTEVDGVATDPNEAGHFDFFEFSSFSICESFSLVGTL